MIFFALVVLTLLTIMCHSVHRCKMQGATERAAGTYVRAQGRWRRRTVVGVYALATATGMYVSWRSLTKGHSNATALVWGVGVQKLLMFLFDTTFALVYK